MPCSGEQKVTTALLKVDLDCYQCYKKIKRTLCGFPQVRNQVYDEKQNMVIITIVCCSPERVLDKLCAKAGKTIKSVQIKSPSPPAPAPAPTPTKPKPQAPPPKPEKPKPAAPAPEPEKPKPKPAPEAQPAKSDDKPPPMKKNGSKNGSKNGGPKSDPPAAAAAPPKAAEEPPKQAAAPPPKPNEPAQFTGPVPQWVPGYPPGPPSQVYPVSVYCPPPPCYDGGYHHHHHQGGYGPGPGQYQYGRPQCPPGYYGNRCDYFSEENPSACSIM